MGGKPARRNFARVFVHREFERRRDAVGVHRLVDVVGLNNNQ